MAESIVKLIVDATQGVRSLGRFKKATDEAAKKTDLLKKAVRLQKAATEAATRKLAQFGDIAKSAFGKASKAAQKYQSALGGIKGAIVSLGVAALTKRMIGQAASFQQTQIRLKALSAEYGEFGKIQQLVKDNAKTFNLSQAEAASQFSDIYARLRPLGKTLEEVQTVYKGFNATAIASGTSAAAASGAFLQLSQALGSGRLQGDEFRSVSEQIPGILGLVADEMGVAVSELKTLGSEGKITSDILINALAKGFEKNKDKIQAILSESPAAKFKEFSNATSELSNAIGTELLPVVTPAVQELTKLLKAAGGLPKPLLAVAAAIAGIGSAALIAAPGVVALGKAIAFISGAGLLAAAPWLALAAGIAYVAKGAVDAKTKIDNLEASLRDASGTGDELKQKMQETADKIETLKGQLDKAGPSAAFLQKKIDLLTRSLNEMKGRYDIEIVLSTFGVDVASLEDGFFGPAGAAIKPKKKKKPTETPTPTKTGRTGPDPAVEARQRAERIAQQLKNSEEMKINLDGQFSVLTEIDEREKIRIATMFELSAINRKYNDLTAAALSNEEKRNLEIARGLELGTARIEQGKALEAIQKAEMASQVDFLKNQFAAAAEIDAQIEAQGEKMKDVYKGIGDSIQNGVVDALLAAVDGTKSLAEVASATLKDIGNMFIKLGINQLFNSLGSGGGILGKLFNSAKGNIIAQNKIVPFAKGGIVGEPTIFPLANGTGLMGEAGPEAIMPLKRGPGGRLGVEVASTRQQLNNQQAVASTREQLDRQRAVASTREQLNNQQAKAMQPLDIRYESTVINNVEYVTAEQHRKGMAQAAERGRAMTLTTLQNSPRTRSRVGI
jgi:tape measure domain-containing protein